MAFVEYGGKVLSSDQPEDKTFTKGPEGFELGSLETLKNQLGNDWWHAPAAMIGTYGLGIATKAAYDWYKSKLEKPDAVRVEPTLQPEAPVSPVAIAEGVESPSKIQQAKERLKQGQAAGISPVAPPPAPSYNAPTANVPQIGVQAPAPAPVQAQMGAAPAQLPATTVTQAVEAGVSPSKAIQLDVAQQVDQTPIESEIKKRAAKTQVTFKAPEQLPKDLSFRADLGPGDNWLFNTYGPEGRKAILQQFNEGKPAVSYERAKELSQMVQGERSGPAIPRDIAKERGIAPPDTNYGKLGKAVKVAGAAGLALTAAQMAQAAQQAQQGDYSAAREFGFNLLGMIPGLGTAFNLGTFSPEAGAGEQKELAKRRRMTPTVD